MRSPNQPFPSGDNDPKGTNNIPEIPGRERTSVATAGHSHLYPSGLVVHHVTPNDVVLGRGVAIAQYRGNVRYRKLIGTRKMEYNGTSRHRHKKDIARKILAEIRTWGGQFLQPGMTEAWVTVDESVALTKIKQALRETPAEAKSPGAALDDASVPTTATHSPERAIEGLTKSHRLDTLCSFAASLEPVHGAALGSPPGHSIGLLKRPETPLPDGIHNDACLMECESSAEATTFKPNELDDLDPFAYHPELVNGIDTETAALLLSLWNGPSELASQSPLDPPPETIVPPMESTSSKIPREPFEFSCPIVQKAESILRQSAASRKRCSPTNPSTVPLPTQTPFLVHADRVATAQCHADSHVTAMVDVLQSDVLSHTVPVSHSFAQVGLLHWGDLQRNHRRSGPSQSTVPPSKQPKTRHPEL